MAWIAVLFRFGMTVTVAHSLRKDHSTSASRSKSVFQIKEWQQMLVGKRASEIPSDDCGDCRARGSEHEETQVSHVLLRLVCRSRFPKLYEEKTGQFGPKGRYRLSWRQNGSAASQQNNRAFAFSQMIQVEVHKFAVHSLDPLDRLKAGEKS